MRKTGIITGLIILLLLAGCGAKDKSNKRNDEVDYQTEENLDSFESTPEEENTIDEITQEQAMDIAYRYAISEIENAGEKEIAISFEKDTELAGDVCYTFRISEETDEQSLTLGFYAVGYFSRIIYRMDPVSGEYVSIGEVDFNGTLIDMGSTGNITYSGEWSLDELVEVVQKSKRITFELAQEPGTQATLPAEDMDYLKLNFTTEGLKTIDYPFLFIPEYRVSCDTGVEFYIMQDPTGSDFNLYVLQFAGSEILYSAHQFVYDSFGSLLSFSTEESMSQMHIFANGTDTQAAINAAVNGNGVYIAALEYFEKSGYALASMMEEDIFRVDDYKVMDMAQVNPNLVSVMIEYSVKTASETAEDSWVTGNLFVCAVWIDQRDTQTRAYVLGVKPYKDESAQSLAEMTESIYMNSLASR